MPDFRTESQKVADELREAILSGEIAPGTRLPQRTVASKFGTTAIVAREALRVASSEGLVLIEPRFGAMVEEVTPDKLQERYTVREALEGMAARLAARNISESGKLELQTLARRCDDDLPSDRLTRHQKAELHLELHNHISGIADCGELARLLDGLYLHSIIVSNAYHIDWFAETAGWHTLLVGPILDGDEDTSEQIMRNHVRRGLEMELTAVNGQG